MARASACGSWYVVDTRSRRWVESSGRRRESARRPATTRPAAEPLADRLRRRDRVHPDRARRELAGRRRRRRARDRLRLPLDPRRHRLRSRARAASRAGDASRRRRGSATPLEGRRRCRRSARRRSTAYPRSTFLSAATLGLGARDRRDHHRPGSRLRRAARRSRIRRSRTSISGPLENFPEGQFVIATYLEDPEIGEVTRRTVFVRNNGLLERPAELHGPLLALRPPRLPGAAERARLRRREEDVRRANVELTPTLVIGFGCPCHGGQYDTEGNRTAGPPVRALDRAEFSIRDGKLWLGSFYSVASVESTGARARIKKYGRAPAGRPCRRARGLALPDRGADGNGDRARESARARAAPRSRRRRSTRSTGSRSAPGSSAGSSTSSSARSRATRTGCRRSARPR